MTRIFEKNIEIAHKLLQKLMKIICLLHNAMRKILFGNNIWGNNVQKLKRAYCANCTKCESWTKIQDIGDE